MNELFLITGATGFLGSTLAKAALARGKQVVGLKLPQDRSEPIPGVAYQEGDVTKPDTLTGFFERANGRQAVLVHCAGLVSIGSDREEQVRQVNVEGTKNIVAMALQHKIGKMVYVSSVHAIREKPDGETITEPVDFSSDGVVGIYGKSKADATAHVLGAAAHGLNVCTVHPSGMIGPEDHSGGYMTETIRAFWKGAFPVAITGGYDFVDVRDVAEGILSCAEHGQRGESYILSNRYISVQEMFEILSRCKGVPRRYTAVPLGLLKPFASLMKWVENRLKLPKLITPYSLYTLGSNGHFSHAKADRVLGYQVRPLEQTLADTAAWLRSETV